MKLPEDYTDEDFINAAREIHGRDGEIEIDDGAPVSRGDDNGAYVQAWVWVDAAYLPNKENTDAA